MKTTTDTTKSSSRAAKAPARRGALEDLRHRPDASTTVAGGASGGVWFLRNSHSAGLADH